jgi:hypothetical protein
MKNETARREIESLDFYLQNHTDDYSEESHTAMMMAIDALNDAVLDKIRGAIEREADYQDAYVDADVAKGLYMALEIINNLTKGE